MVAGAVNSPKLFLLFSCRRAPHIATKRFNYCEAEMEKIIFVSCAILIVDGSHHDRDPHSGSLKLSMRYHLRN